MTEAKHTPGPWELGRVDTMDLDDNPVPARDAGYVSMGDENEADISGPDAPANARLIAAAPDMLAAITMIRTQVNFDITRGGGLFSDTDLAAIDTAIAKATGAK